MTADVFSLDDVLAIAKSHPFYVSQIQYPPNRKAVRVILQEAAAKQPKQELCHFQLTTKKELYKTIKRLTEDASPENTYRQSSYLSITGGGTGGRPMLFATDAVENRIQRARIGKLIRSCGVIEPQDWVLTTHVSGDFYRSLDLTQEILENAGASVLSAGHNMSPDDVTSALAHFHVNAISGDGSQVIRVIDYISTLPAEKRQQIKLNKIIYTSEPLTPAQRAYITATLGPVEICSLLGSSEAGPWAVGKPSLTGAQPSAGANDFIFDTRMMLIEILDPSTLDVNNAQDGKSVPDGTPGIIVQTSLLRLRNPLVRYVSGDMGSLHPLPDTASTMIDPDELKHLRVLRLYGRDSRFSFKWYGAYYEFDNIVTFMQTEKWGILQWQIVLDRLESSPQLTLEIRIFRSSTDDRLVSEITLVEELERFFFVQLENRPLFQVKFLPDQTTFERSGTAAKIIRFVNKVN